MNQIRSNISCNILCYFLAVFVGLSGWQTGTLAQPPTPPAAKPAAAPSPPASASPRATSPSAAASPVASSVPAQPAKAAKAQPKTAPTVEAPAVEAKPVEAKPKADAAKPVSAEVKPAETKPVTTKLLDSRGQPASYTLLAHPSVADRLKLSDQQRAKVTELMTARSAALAQANGKDRPKVIDEFEAKLAGVLSDAQVSEWRKTPPEPLLRFNYRFQRWVDVLEEVAKQAGLSLVLEAPPPGTFNYSDSRDYTPTEAIDLLNGVLVTKGFTLVRREKMLVLVDLSEGIPEGLIPRVPLEELDNRGKFEMVSVLFPLKGRNAAAVSAEIGPLLGPRGKVVPLPATGQLLLTDTAGIMKAINAVIESMPVPPASAARPAETPTPVVYPIKNADPPTVLKVLQTLLPTATFALDPKTDQIHAHGGPSVQAAVKSVIEQIQSNAPADKKPRLERYPLSESTASELIKTLTAIVPEAKLSRDPQTGSLIAWATPSEQETIKGVVEKLGGDAGLERSRQFQVYRLTKAAPATAMTLLQELFPHAKIAVDKPTGNLVVIGTLAEQKAVQGILEQLQTEQTGPAALAFKAYPLTTADAASTLATLKTLYPHAQIALDAKGQRLLVTAISVDQTAIKASLDQIQTPTPKEQQSRFESYRLHGAEPSTLVANLQTLVPQAKITVDRTAGALVVFGTSVEHEMVQGALAKLGRGPGAEGVPQVEIHRLTKADPRTLLTTLQPLVPDAKLNFDPPTKSLVALAVPADQKTIRNVLEQMQSELPADKQPRLETYAIHGADAAPLVANLQPVIPEAKITVDAKYGKLVVWGTPAEHDALKAALAKLGRGQGAEAVPQVEIYRLTKADPRTLLTTLQPLVPDAKLNFDPPTKSLVALAVPADQKTIRNVLEQMQSELPADKQPRLETYAIHGADAAPLVANLQPVIPEAKITVDAKYGKLVVWGTPAEHEAMKAALAKLSRGQGVEGVPQLEVYRLSKLEPAAVIATLQSLAPDAKLVVDAASKSVIALAVPADQKAIRNVLEQLQSGKPPADAPQLRFYPLSQTPPAAMVSVLQALAPKAQVTLDSAGRRLTVVATPEDHEVLKAAIEQVDKTVQAEEKRKLVTYAVSPSQRARFQAIAASLTTELPGLQVMANSEAGELVIWAKPSQQVVIADMLEQLKREVPTSEKYELAAYPIKAATSTSVVSVLKTLFPNAQITPDSRSRRLLIWALPADQQAIKAALEKIDAARSSDTQEKLMVYPVPYLDPAITIKTLQEALPEVNLVSDVKAGTLLAWVAPWEHETIEKMLKQLQAAADSQNKPKLVVYPAADGDPAAMALMLRALVPRAQVVADAKTRSIGATATPQEHEMIAAAVEQMSKKEPPEKAHRLVTYTIEAGRRGAISTLLSILGEKFPDARFTPGLERGHIFAWARPDDQKRIQTMLDELTKNTPPPDLGYKLVIYTLESGGTVAVNSAVGILKSMFPDATVNAGSEPGSLLTWARPQDHPRIAQIVKEVGKAGPPETAPRLEVYTLHATASKGRLAQAPNVGAVAVLKTMFPEAQFSTGTNGKDVVVLARPAEHVKIKAAVAELDKKEPPESAPRVIVYSLESVGPRGVTGSIAILQTLFPEAQFSTGSEPGSLVALARPDDQQAIKAAIDEMSKKEPPEKAHRLVTYTIEAGRRGAISTLLSILGEKFPDARFTPGLERGHIFAWARPDDQKRIQTMLDELTKNTPPPDLGYKLVIYTLESGGTVAVNSAVGILKSMFPDATVNAGSEPGSLLTWARPQDHPRIAQIVKEVGKAGPPETAPRLEVYRLHSASPSKGRLAEAPNVAAVAVLKTMFPESQFSTGTNGKDVVVLARPAEHVKIKAAVAELDKKEPPESAPRVIAYTLESAGPKGVTGAIAILQALFPEAQFSMGSERGSLVALARPDDHQAIKAAIDEMSKKEPPEKAHRLVTYTIEAGRRGALSTLISILGEKFPDARFTPGLERGHIFAWARPDDQKGIQAMLDELTKNTPPPDLGYKLVIYTLESGGAVAVNSAVGILKSMFPDATVNAGSEPGSLLTWARPQDHPRIAQIVKEVGKAGPPETAPRLEVYTIHGATPSKGRSAEAPNVGAVAVLKTMFPESQFSTGTNGKDVVALARPAEHVKIKAAVAELNKKEPPESAPRVIAYTLESAGPKGVTGAIAILQTLFPEAQFSAGTEPGSLVALARPDDQQAIKAAVDEMSKKEPPEKAPSVATYRLEAIDAATAIGLLRAAFVDARFSAGVDASNLVVWARPADQALIKKTIAEIESAGGPNDKRVLSVYPFKSSDVTALSQLLDPALRRGIQLVPDAARGRLLVWADAKHQDAVKGVIEQFAREAAKAGEPTSQVYRFAWADPKAAYTVLATLVPNAQIALDPGSRTLVVSAMPEDHAKIKATVAEMDRRDANGQTPRLEIYRFQSSDPARVMPVLQGLFRLYPEVRVSLDSANGAILALATPAQQETIRSLVEQVEKQAALDANVVLKTYPLGDADATSTLRMITALLEKEGRKVQLSLEPYDNSLVAIARPEQHKTIQAALEQLKPEERTLEVVQLEAVDPATARLAIERLFSDGSFAFSSSSPTLDIDDVTQQLFIRATAKQHEKIRQLLTRMGETNLGQPSGVDLRRSRQIPFDGDLNAALEEIRRVWPQLRANPIQVVVPPPGTLIRQRAPETAPPEKQPIRPAAGPQAAPGKPLPKNEVLPPAVPKSGSAPKPPPKGAAADAAKPVFVVPGEGTVTITSDDPAALNQLEMLLRAMSQQRGAVGRNYHVFLLRNAKASGVAATLQQVFRAQSSGGRGATRGRPSSSMSVVVVPDERLNAIVAYANRTDRLTIENLLKVLDTAEMPEPLAADRLQLIPIKNTSAEKIVQSLNTMFRSYVDGFSVEETTNSVVVIAAPQTVEEIKRVAGMLDEAAGGKASREVEIVPLRKLKSAQVERALEVILKQPQRVRSRPTPGPARR